MINEMQTIEDVWKMRERYARYSQHILSGFKICPICGCFHNRLHGLAYCTPKMTEAELRITKQKLEECENS